MARQDGEKKMQIKFLAHTNTLRVDKFINTCI
jgi:hypothetical protein